LSYPTHLIKVNNRFYFKVKVPVDLAYYFPCRFIKKALKTNSLQVAKAVLAALENKTQNVFALLRTGLVPAELVPDYLFFFFLV